MLFSFTERLCSAGLLPRVSSAVSLVPSDESVESIGRLQMRSNSIPNNSPALSVDRDKADKSKDKDSHNYFNNNNIKKKLTPSTRRLSVKTEEMPGDSIC